MRIFGLVPIAFSVLFMTGLGICADPQAGSPIGFIGGCAIDLNADGNPDSALLINTGKSYELIVIMRLKEGLKSYVLDRSETSRYLTCNYGTQLKETEVGLGKKPGRTYTTNGFYLALLQPESSAVAYFWSDGKFKEVWLSD